MSPIIPDYTRQQDGSRQEDRREMIDAEMAADRKRLREDTYVGFGL